MTYNVTGISQQCIDLQKEINTHHDSIVDSIETTNRMEMYLWKVRRKAQIAFNIAKEIERRRAVEGRAYWMGREHFFSARCEGDDE